MHRLVRVRCVDTGAFERLQEALLAFLLPPPRQPPEAYVGEVFDRLLPWLKNVYLQNQILKEDGAVTLNTWCRGPIGFDLIPVHAPGGIDFPAVFEELQRVGYQGPITVHQSAQPGASPLQTAMQSAQYLRTLMS